ncbi:MAG: hypothetical protein Q4E24_09750 [bacterium]|nr:hypothetical protein [bacterium]
MGKVNLYNVYGWKKCRENVTAGEVEKLTGMPSANLARCTQNGPCVYMQYKIERQGEKLFWEEWFRQEWQQAVERLKG